MDWVRFILAGGVMVGVLVVIHELGHFLAARLFGVGTPIFSFGIGPPIFTLFQWKDTRFVVSALPIGGYVQMAGADPFGEEDPETSYDPDRDFMRKPVWQRLIIMLAGPAMNLVLPVVLFTAVLMGGEPQVDSSVGTVVPGRIFEQVGVEPGDRIVEVAGERVDTWVEVLLALEPLADRGEVPIALDRGGERVAVVLPAGAVRHGKSGRLDLDALGGLSDRRSSRIGVSDPTSPAWRAGVRPGDAIVEVDGVPLTTFEELRAALAEEIPHDLVVARAEAGKVEKRPVRLEPDPAWEPAPTETDRDRWGIVHLGVFVGYVLPGSAADTAGVKASDRLVAIDGDLIRSWSDVIGLVARTVDEAVAAEAAERSGGCTGGATEVSARPLVLEIVRDGVPMRLEFAPRFERELVGGLPNFRPIMGIRQFPDAYVDGPQIQKHYGPREAVGRALEECALMVQNTFAILGKLVTNDIGVTEGLGGPIAILRAAGDAAERGLFTFVRMMGGISLSLGIVNLLPVPVLDGGQILFYAIEGIRGRPLPLALRERIQMVGILLLAALFVVVFASDVSDIFKG